MATAPPTRCRHIAPRPKPRSKPARALEGYSFRPNLVKAIMEIRCGSCGRLLAKGTGTIEIKCPRCRTINYVRAASPDKPREGEDKECSRVSTGL